MRAEVIYHGRVQGVGFRATAHDLALRRRITGWVRNEADCAVRLVAEGPEAEVLAYLEDIRARLGDYITSEHVDTGEERGAYSGFEIRR